MSIPIAELPAKYAGALCASYSSCMGPLLDAWRPGEDCTTRTRRRIDDDLSDIEAAVASGTVRYDGTKLQACADKIASLGCGVENQRGIDECFAAVGGTVAAGQPCDMDLECAKGNFCKSDAACPGTCTSLLTSGATCTNGDQCASGLGCDKGKCLARALVGTPCGLPDDPECALGLMCVGSKPGMMKSGQCRAIADVFAGSAGDTCNIEADQLCKTGTACTVQDAMFTQKCTAEVPSGGACKVASPDPCPSDEFCKTPGSVLLGVTDGTCTKKPKNGENCGPNPVGMATVCGPYMVCNMAGKCADLEHVGGPCEKASSCYSETCRGGKCVASGKCD